MCVCLWCSCRLCLLNSGKGGGGDTWHHSDCPMIENKEDSVERYTHTYTLSLSLSHTHPPTHTHTQELTRPKNCSTNSPQTQHIHTHTHTHTLAHARSLSLLCSFPLILCSTLSRSLCLSRFFSLSHTPRKIDAAQQLLNMLLSH